MDGVCAVRRHVGPGPAGISRQHHGAMVRIVFAVAVGTADVDDVRETLGGVDEVVDPALAAAEVEAAPARISFVRGRQVTPHGRTGLDHVAAKDAAVLDTDIAFTELHARVTVGQGRDRDPRQRGRHRRVEGSLDLGPGRAAVARAPDTARVRGGIDDVRVRRIENNLTHANWSAIRNKIGGYACGVVAADRIGPARMDERPGLSAVRGLVDAPWRRPRNHDPLDARAADRGHSADRAYRRQVHDVGISRVDCERSGAATVEDRPSDGSAPGVAAVGGLVETDTMDASATTGVGFTGANPECISGWVRRINGDRANRVDVEGAAEIPPLRVIGKGVVGTPNTAGCLTNPQPAVARFTGRS